MKRSIALAAALAAAPLSHSVSAADRTWDGEADGLWSNPINWDGNAAIPADGDNIGFLTALNQTVDVEATRITGSLLFNSPNLYTLNNGTITFNGSLTQNGAGNAIINTPLVLAGPGVYGGSGAGLVRLNGLLAGPNPLTVNAGRLVLATNANLFGGPVTVNGGVLEALGSPNIQFNSSSNNASTHFGATASGAVTINGGTIKLTTQSGGGGTVGGTINMGRGITFGANGGLLDITNTVGGTLGGGTAVVNARLVGGGSGAFPLTTTAGATAPAVIRFNGGEIGLSNPQSLRDWSTGGNSLRPSGLSGTGPLRIELSNGAMYRQGTGGSGNINVPMPLTIAGPSGQDPTSGPAGTVNPGITQNIGRVATDNFSVLNYSQGLTLQGALQVGAQGAARAIDGNITLAGTGSGNPAFVSFSGRATGTSLISDTNTGAVNLQAPGAGNAGLNPLYIGQGRNDTLTIQGGAIAAMDLRHRTDQSNHNGVLLDARTVINPGGTLRFMQSVSNNFSTNSAVLAPGNVGYHIVRNNIQGEGTTAQDSVVDLYLPFDNNVTSSSPLGGVEFQGTNVALVVNGSGLGGLRVNGLTRPAALVGAGGDPVSNADKVANLLSTERLQGLTGTGGYLTPAAQDAAAPITGEWAAGVPVGLRVVNSNAGGDDVIIQTPTWSHSLHVDPGASVFVGNDVGLNGGTISGSGTLASTGLNERVTIGGTAVLNPGAPTPADGNIVGTMSITGGLDMNATATYRPDISGSGNDRLNVQGVVALTGSILDVALNNSTSPAEGTTFGILANDGTDAISGIFAGLPEGAVFPVVNLGTVVPETVLFRISYAGDIDGGGNDVVLTTVVPEPTLLGGIGLAGAALLGRRRRK